jgi:hypothetical protein
MRLKTVATFALAGLFGVSVAAIGVTQSRAQGADDTIITSAMSAAPKPVADAATIIVMNKDGTARVVRKGTNGFTCMPDNPTTPGPDPMCLDTNAMEWAHAWMTKGAPPNKVGFMYMLAGGSDASNTDPYAAGPSAGNNWVSTGPHIMIVGPGAAAMAGYPTSPSPDTTKPYVMWANTPYAHLMIPMK